MVRYIMMVQADQQPPHRHDATSITELQGTVMSSCSRTWLRRSNTLQQGFHSMAKSDDVYHQCRNLQITKMNTQPPCCHDTGGNRDEFALARVAALH